MKNFFFKCHCYFFQVVWIFLGCTHTLSVCFNLQIYIFMCLFLAEMLMKRMFNLKESKIMETLSSFTLLHNNGIANFLVSTVKIVRKKMEKLFSTCFINSNTLLSLRRNNKKWMNELMNEWINEWMKMYILLYKYHLQQS